MGVRKMKMFVSVPNDLVDDEDAMGTELAMMRTGGGASWSLYYDESGSTQSIASSGSLEKAMASFVQFHERQPTNSEVQQIRSFLSLKLPVHNEADYNSTKMVMARHCIGSELNVNPRCWCLRWQRRSRRSDSMCIWRTASYRRKRRNK